MDREEKIKLAIFLTGLLAAGSLASQKGVKPVGLSDYAWGYLFKNCYQGVNEMIKMADEMDSSSKPKSKKT